MEGAGGGQTLRMDAGAKSPASQRVSWRDGEHLGRMGVGECKGHGVGMSCIIWQMEPQRRVSHSTQDGVTVLAEPGGE